jgi:hypothetical protein
MENKKLREEVIQMVMQGDEGLLQVFHEIGNEYKGKSFDVKSEKAELERRRIARMEGKTEVYPWSEARELIISRINK